MCCERTQSGHREGPKHSNGKRECTGGVQKATGAEVCEPRFLELLVEALTPTALLVPASNSAAFFSVVVVLQHQRRQTLQVSQSLTHSLSQSIALLPPSFCRTHSLTSPPPKREMASEGRVFNFSPGPAVLPEPVLRQAAAEMLNYHGCGMSIMEVSHRTPTWEEVIKKAEANLRALLSIPANYKVCDSSREEEETPPLFLVHATQSCLTVIWPLSLLSLKKRCCSMRVERHTSSLQSRST